jgi:hypothetical protein
MPSAAVLVLLAVLLSGCLIVTERPPFYTRYEVDAINAEVACRSLARNTLQMERCTVRR